MKRLLPLMLWCLTCLSWAAAPLALQRDADLQGGAAPDIANRTFIITVQIGKPGTQGVLAAQGGQLHGWSLFLQDGKLHFVMNRESARSDVTSDDAALNTISATLFMNNERFKGDSGSMVGVKNQVGTDVGSEGTRRCSTSGLPSNLRLNIHCASAESRWAA